jgi:hypothetical protein
MSESLQVSRGLDQQWTSIKFGPNGSMQYPLPVTPPAGAQLESAEAYRPVQKARAVDGIQLRGTAFPAGPFEVIAGRIQGFSGFILRSLHVTTPLMRGSKVPAG